MLASPRVLYAAGVLCLCPALLGQPATFIGLGPIPGHPGSSAVALSADGLTVIGPDYAVASTHPSRWTLAAGWVAMPHPLMGWWAGGVSADGSVVVGGNDFYKPVRWTQATGAVVQGSVAGYPLYAFAQGVAWDGAVLVGGAYGESNQMCFSNCFGYPSRPLTESSGFRQAGPGQTLNRRSPLPGYSSSLARGISGDGTAIVGESLNWVCTVCGGSIVSSRESCMWIGGGPPISLGMLPGVSLSSARAASADGSVIVGTDSGRAFRWRAGSGKLDLGASNFPDSAMGVSGDGAVVVGRDAALGAFVWSAARGTRSLRAVLESELGLSLGGWVLASAVAVSADGRTIVGNGTGPAGVPEAWIAFLGDPVGGDCYANCDGSTAAPTLNINDFTCFLNRFAAGILLPTAISRPRIPC